MNRLTDAFHTRCPYCKTVFRVRPEHLAIAEGRVRCGQCFSVFAAEEHLAISAPPRGDFASAALPSGVLNELGEEHDDAGSEPAARLAARRVTASVSTRRSEETDTPAEVNTPSLPIRSIVPATGTASPLDEALTDQPSRLAPRDIATQDDALPTKPGFSALDEDETDDSATPMPRPRHGLGVGGAGRDDDEDDFDPDDPDYAIDDALLDDSVLGPLPTRQEPSWLDEPDVEAALLADDEATLTDDGTGDAEEDHPRPDWEDHDTGAVQPSWTARDAEPDNTAAHDAEPARAPLAGYGYEHGDEPAHEIARDFQDEELEDELAEVLERQPDSPLGLFAWGLGSLALLALLAGQLFWGNRDSLAQSPAWRPYAEQACSFLRCTLKPMRDVASIQLGASALKPNPAQAGAFDVHLMLLNRAGFAQPYPVIELSFTNLDGKRLASRRFKPEEYLAKNVIGQSMPAGTPVHVRFAILAPDASASGFEFRFYE